MVGSGPAGASLLLHCCYQLLSAHVTRSLGVCECFMSWTPKFHLGLKTQQASVEAVKLKHYAMKTYRGERCSSTFLDLGTRWRWVVSLTPLPLYLRGESPRYPLDRRLGRFQRRSGRCGEEKKISLPGIEPEPFSLSLNRLSYPGSDRSMLHNKIYWYILAHIHICFLECELLVVFRTWALRCARGKR
jgi:hypothetical protein